MIDEWRYLQIKHFVTSLLQPLRMGKELTPFDKLWSEQNKGSDVAIIYRILGNLVREEVPPFIKKWEGELGSRVGPQIIYKMLELTHKAAVDSNTQEMNYKCLAR